MYLPNAREDEAYNEKYLLENDKQFLSGFDYAIDKVMGMFFANLDIFDFTVEGEDIDIGRIFANHPDISALFQGNMKQYFESERNELVVSMIENMDDDEYERIKEEVDSKEGK